MKQSNEAVIRSHAFERLLVLHVTVCLTQGKVVMRDLIIKKMADLVAMMSLPFITFIDTLLVTR
jgi:hypothetical protein